MNRDLPPLTVAGRLERVRAAAGAAGVDALVLTAASNIRWVSGFTGSAGTLVVGPDEAVLWTDSRYETQAPAELGAAGSEAVVRITRDVVADASAALDDAVVIGLEADTVTWAEQRRWAAARSTVPVATEGLVAELRAVKDEAELARMARAAAIVDTVLSEVIAMLEPGTTETAVAAALDDGMRAAGAVGPAYDTIVAAGPNAALPHARPSTRPMVDGDLVVIDVGAVVDGYRSDMTRTFVVGEPGATEREIHSLVTRAQAAGVAAVRAGARAADIDDACRSVIEAAGYGDAFGHGTGHGVGLDIHELPAVRAGNTAILQPGHVITVEPGIYLPGRGGVRVEDMVVVTPDGCRPLTRHPKLSLA